MELAKQSGKTSLPGRTSLQDYLRDLLAEADIQVGGDRPWDMQVNNPGVAERIFTEGSLGLGEGYMDGDWEAQALDEFIHRVLRARLHRQVRPARVLLHYLKSRLLNRQTVSRAKEVGERHYDLGNDFYRAMLDSRMTYTCGYWKDADTWSRPSRQSLT